VDSTGNQALAYCASTPKRQNSLQVHILFTSTEQRVQVTECEIEMFGFKANEIGEICYVARHAKRSISLRLRPPSFYFTAQVDTQAQSRLSPSSHSFVHSKPAYDQYD
jgi:hypothetical protein